MKKIKVTNFQNENATRLEDIQCLVEAGSNDPPYKIGLAIRIKKNWFIGETGKPSILTFPDQWSDSTH